MVCTDSGDPYHAPAFWQEVKQLVSCRHVDVHTEGSEACQHALDTIVKLPKARELFDESLDRFRDVTCIGLCNWANVHLCLAKKLMENAAETGQKVSEIRKEFEQHCADAIKRYNEALGYNGAASCLPIPLPLHLQCAPRCASS